MLLVRPVGSGLRPHVDNHAYITYIRLQTYVHSVLKTVRIVRREDAAWCIFSGEIVLHSGQPCFHDSQCKSSNLQEPQCSAQKQCAWSLGTVVNNDQARKVPVLGLVASNAALRRGQIIPSISFAVSGTVLHSIVSAAQRDVVASAVSPLHAGFRASSLEALDQHRSKL